MEQLPATLSPIVGALSRFKLRHLVVMLALAGIVLFVACGGSGETARDFEVVQYDGETFRLSEVTEGHAVVLNLERAPTIGLSVAGSKEFWWNKHKRRPGPSADEPGLRLFRRRREQTPLIFLLGTG